MQRNGRYLELRFDDRLKYSGTAHFSDWDSAADFLVVSPEDVWVPDVRLANAVEFNTEENCEQGDVHIYDDQHGSEDEGRNFRFNAFYARPCVYTFKCAVDMADFPFDAHRCNLKFQSRSRAAQVGGIHVSFGSKFSAVSQAFSAVSRSNTRFRDRRVALIDLATHDWNS